MNRRRRRAAFLALALAPVFGTGVGVSAVPAIVPPEAAITDDAARRALALSLAWSGARAEARPLLQELANANPTDAEIVRTLEEIAASDPGAADRVIVRLRERVAREPGDIAAKIALADHETGIGHAAAAQALWDDARRLQAPTPGDDFDLRHARSRLTWGDFYPAETAFRAALEATPADAALRDSLIGLLIAMDRLERAEAEALLWLSRDPESPEAQTAVFRYLKRVNPMMAEAFREDMFPKAKVTPPAEPDALTTEFRTAGPERTREPEFLFGYTADADRYHAKGEPLPPGLVIPASSTALVQLAGLYAGQGDFELSIRCFRAARLADPENFSAWIGLAEFLAIAQHYDEAHREFAALALVFPTNRQVLLKQARALGWGRRYEDSLIAYTALRALNPADPVPLLEQARVAGWAKRREHAAELYAQRWADPVDARLRAALRSSMAAFEGWSKDHAVLKAWRDWAESPARDTDYAQDDEPFAATERFENEFSVLLADVPDCLAGDLKRVRLDLRADFLLQRAFWLENRAKQLAWDRRWWRSEQTYDRLLAIAPGNQEALFDLSQVQAAQGLGDRERVTLGRLLAIDANNRLADSALFRRERRSEPLVFGQLDYYRERGRDDLSSMRRLRTGFGGETMIDDRFRLRGALLRWRESPYTRSEDFRARGFSVGAEGVFANWLTVSAEYTHKDDTGPGIGDVDTGGVQAWVPFKDAVRVGAGVEVREELANEFAYFQGIRSTHRWFGAEAALSRRAEIAARADFIDYADDNGGTHFWIAPAYTWTEHPRTLKTTVTFEARDTDEANVYRFAGGDLVDITHPYWTPEDYRGVALTLEWRHDLAKDFFIGAQEHWYDVRVTFGASNDSNQGASWAADYAREWRDRWVLRLGVAQTFSEQWDDFRAQARLAFRF